MLTDRLTRIPMPNWTSSRTIPIRVFFATQSPDAGGAHLPLHPGLHPGSEALGRYGSRRRLFHDREAYAHLGVRGSSGLSFRVVGLFGGLIGAGIVFLVRRTSPASWIEPHGQSLPAGNDSA
jgi:hypothetical protein